MSHLSIYDLSISLVTEAQLCHNLKFQGFNELITLALYKKIGQITRETVTLCEYPVKSIFFFQLWRYAAYFLPNVSNIWFACHVVAYRAWLHLQFDEISFHVSQPLWDSETFDEPHFVRGTRRYNTMMFAIGPRSLWDSHSFEPQARHVAVASRGTKSRVTTITQRTIDAFLSLWIFTDIRRTDFTRYEYVSRSKHPYL